MTESNISDTTMISNDQFDSWECTEETRYFTVSWVDRTLYIKMDLDKKYWTSVYVNQYNPKYCEVKCEPASPRLWKYRTPISKSAFDSKLNEVYNRSYYAR